MFSVQNRLRGRPVELALKDAVENLNRETTPVLAEVRQGLNQLVHAEEIEVAGYQLPNMSSRFNEVIALVDTTHADWGAGGDLVLPEAHQIGDRVTIVDMGGNAATANIAVVDTSGLLFATVISDYGSLVFVSTGSTWVRIGGLP